MKRVIKLTESDLEMIVKRVLNEQLANVVNTPKQIQQKLIDLEYDLGTSGPNKDGVDGYIGSRTRNAIKDFQTKNNIKPTGVLDQTTRNKLFLANKVSKQVGFNMFGKPPQNVKIKKTPTKGGLSKTSTTNSKEQKEKEITKKVVGTTEVSNPDAYLQFNGEQLQWVVGGKVIKTWDAVSGLTLFNTPISNWGQMIKGWTISPEKFSKDKDAGPTPPGKYTVGPIQSRQGDTETVGVISALWKKLTGKFDNTPVEKQGFYSNSDYSKVGWGNYRATITPQSGTDTHGRSSFYIHGGALPGSHGCIDLTDEMGDFAKFYGTWSAITNKRSIPLIVNYKTPNHNEFISKLWKGTSNGSSNYEKYKQNNRWSMDPGKI
jgi:hypothetical protein